VLAVAGFFPKGEQTRSAHKAGHYGFGTVRKAQLRIGKIHMLFGINQIFSKLSIKIGLHALHVG